MDYGKKKKIKCSVCRKNFLALRATKCKDCTWKAWREKNPEKVKSYRKNYYKKNKKDVKENSKNYYHKNKKKRKAVIKTWRDKNPDKVEKYIQDNKRKNSKQDQDKENKDWGLYDDL